MHRPFVRPSIWLEMLFKKWNVGIYFRKFRKIETDTRGTKTRQSFWLRDLIITYSKLLALNILTRATESYHNHRMQMRNNGIQHLLCSQRYYSAPCPSLQIRMRQSSYPIGLISKLYNCALDIESDSIRISCLRQNLPTELSAIFNSNQTECRTFQNACAAREFTMQCEKYRSNIAKDEEPSNQPTVFVEYPWRMRISLGSFYTISFSHYKLR